MLYEITFQGRQSGAIGIFYPITLTVTIEEMTMANLIDAAADQGYEFNHLTKKARKVACS